MATPEDGGQVPHPSHFVSNQNRNVQTPGEQLRRPKTIGTRQYLASHTNTGFIGIPPLPTDPSGLYSSLLSDSDLTQSKKKFVKVSGIGEVEVEPDRVDFVIQITSVKVDVKEARESIKKRNDYIMSALKKYYIKDWEITSNELVTRVEPSPPQDVLTPGAQAVIPDPLQFKITKEINVHCDNLMKYRHIISVCQEKLDQYVTFSDPIIKFSPAVIQLNTQRAIRQAVTNSQVKASELLGTQNQYLNLGQLIYSVEDYLTIQPLEEYEDAKFESFKWKRLNKRITCQITSVFEIKDRLR